MKRFFLFPSFAFCLLGCAAAGNGSDAPEGPLSWPEGQYVLTASVLHRDDTRMGERTSRSSYTADLDIRAGGFMRLTRGSSVCGDPLPKQMLENRGRGPRTFICEGSYPLTYVINPSEETIGGILQVTVLEGIRQQRCTAYGTSARGGRTCSAYEYYVSSSGTRRNLRLRVERK